MLSNWSMEFDCLDKRLNYVDVHGLVYYTYFLVVTSLI